MLENIVTYVYYTLVKEFTMTTNQINLYSIEIINKLWTVIKNKLCKHRAYINRMRKHNIHIHIYGTVSLIHQLSKNK